MVKRERENGDAPQVDNLLAENAFRSSVTFLCSQGELREREGKTEVVARGHSGIEISVVSPFSWEDLITLSRVGGRRIEEIVLESASRVRVSGEQGTTEEDELTLIKFDPGQLRTIPEEAWKMEELVSQGVQYSVQGTPENLTKRLNQLITGLRRG